jgi:hypothetical protein
LYVGICFFAHTVYAEEKKDSVQMQFDLDGIEILVKREALNTGDRQTYSLSLKSIEQLPQLFGSTDALRTLQLLPGVQTVGEASSGLYIEGCNPSQTLVLLDNAPVFNPVHLGGFFSVFNNDHFKDFHLHKNFISAEYGGRLAAVLIVNSNTDIPERIRSDVNVSILMSNATVRVPLNQKSAIALSGRISYVNPLLDLLTSGGGLTPRSQKQANLRYNFYDLNLGYYYSHGKNEWKFSLYTGQDKAIMNLTEQYLSGYLQWENTTASLNWKHKMGANNLNQTLYYSSYGDDFSLALGLMSHINFLSFLQEVGYKNRLSFETKKLKYSFGLEGLYRSLEPQSLDVSYFSNSNQVLSVNSSEAALFGELTYPFSTKLKATLGMRRSMYFYNDSLSNVETFAAYEPRFNLSYDMSQTLKLSFSAQQQVQYLNQVMNSTIGFPTNFWIQASDEVPYQKSQSVSLGMEKQLFDYEYKFLGNVFYRRLHNQFESIGRIIDMIQKDISQVSRFRTGNGDNYGMGLLFQKKYDNLTGWVGYTLSWAWRKFDEFDKKTPAINDRRHDLNLVLTYDTREKWVFSTSFVLASGTPTTFSKGVYLIGEMPMNLYAEYNSNRLPAYHRLDVSATRKLSIKYFSESHLNFSIYNVYGRVNPIMYSSELRYNNKTGEFRAAGYYHSLFTILPSIGLKLSF